MKPHDLVRYTKAWNWSRDELLKAALLLLRTALEPDEEKTPCYICGDAGVWMGKPCGKCGKCSEE